MDGIDRRSGADPARSIRRARRQASCETDATPARSHRPENRADGCRGAGTAAARGEPDLAFGAFQRGFYLTAFGIATRRVEEKGDVKAMTLLGELYAHGFGVSRDDKKAT